MPRAARFVVEHRTHLPGRDCVAAALIAEAIGCGLGAMPFELVRVIEPGRVFPQPASAEHVTADGRLVANSTFWIERALGSGGLYREAATLDDGIAQPQIVAVNGELLPDGLVEGLRERLAASADTLWLKVREERERIGLIVARGDGVEEPVAELHCDRYGRWHLTNRGLGERVGQHFAAPMAAPLFAQEEPGMSGPMPARLIVIGEDAHLRDVYPTVLAAVGDAADVLGLAPDVQIVSPHAHDWQDVFHQASGIILPGGSDLSQVPGQVVAAWQALQQGVPTLGLCLGMQSMALAVARGLAGLPDAELEECNPATPIPLFGRLRDGQGRDWHRLGARRLRLRAGTKARDGFGCEETVERFNHRYALGNDYLEPLERAGLRVSAVSADEGLTDAIEAVAHPFFVGLQSHPELLSRQATPHPVVSTFLRAAEAHHVGHN